MSRPAPPTDCWLHEAVEVRPSSIEGMGWFAKEDIPTNTVIARLGGKLVTTAELEALFELAAETSGDYVDTITVWDGAHLVLPPRTPLHYGNHSCDPNAWHVGPYTIATRREVTKGEEVTIDYATQSGMSGWRMACACGSGKCRRLITSDDWMLPQLRMRYADHWVPALLERIRET